MSIRPTVKFITHLLLITITSSQLATAQDKPNIVWIMAEDINNQLGCYGEKLVHTTNIDWLAANGVRYTNAFTVSGVCAPSRATIITGMYSTSIGTQHMRQAKSLTPYEDVPVYNAVPPAEVKTFTEYMRANGYFCTNNFKTDYQFGNPFTVWDSHTRTASWRDRPNNSQPFFSCFTFETTHEINVWPDSTKWRFFREFNVDTGRLVADVKRRPVIDEKYIVDPAEVVLPPYYPDDSIVLQGYARHLTNITRMDVQVGEVLAQLREDGLLDNTIVFFMGDNGSGIPRSKRWLNDGGLHVPLIIYIPQKWKGKIQGKVSGVDNRLLSFVDLAPTMLSITGVPIPKHIQGKAFLGEAVKSERQYVFAGRDRMDAKYDLQRAVRSKQYKYIKNYWPDTSYYQHLDFLYQMPLMRSILALRDAGKLNKTQSAWFAPTKPAEELYDVIKDPYELNNLAANPTYKKVLVQMRNQLKQWQEKYGDWLDTPEVIQAGKMWPDGKQPVTYAPKYSVQNNVITLTCNTPGASIGYKYGDENFWRLYTKPIPLQRDKPVQVKAIRYGYAESETLTIK